MALEQQTCRSKDVFLTLMESFTEHPKSLDDLHLQFFRPLSIKLQRGNGSSAEMGPQWWVVEECFPGPPASRCQSIEMLVFNDKVSPSSVGFLAGYG